MKVSSHRIQLKYLYLAQIDLLALQKDKQIIFFSIGDRLQDKQQFAITYNNELDFKRSSLFCDLRASMITPVLKIWWKHVSAKIKEIPNPTLSAVLCLCSEHYHLLKTVSKKKKEWEKNEKNSDEWIAEQMQILVDKGILSLS
jgi:hypothetical protein